MSQTLLIALAASIPVALLAWAAAWAVEAMGAGLRLRLCAWSVALLLPAAPIPAMLAIHALGVPSPFAAIELAPPADSEPVVALIQPEVVPAPAPKPEPRLPIAALLLGLAGAGAALRLGQLGLGLRRVARLKAGSESIADPELAARLGGGVRLADTEVPVLAGLARPVILLPRRLLGGLSAEQAILICAHERAHLAAGDHVTHLLEETMVRLFWFNPFMAATRERLAAAREEACDARALAGCDTGHRREYARTLLAALKLAGHAEPVAAFTGFRRRGAERRLKAILKPSGPGSWRSAAVAILAGMGLAAAVGGFSLAAAAEPPTVATDPSAPLPPAPQPAHPSFAAQPAPAVPPAPEAGAPPGHPHVMIFTRETKHGSKPDSTGVTIREDGTTVRTMVFDDQDWVDGHLRPEIMEKLTPEERKALEEEIARIHAEVGRAMGATFQEIARTHLPTAEEQAKIHQQVEEAMNQAHAAMAMAHEQFAQNDGRVLMRCKLGPDGKAQDCERLPDPRTLMMFEHGAGPHGEMPPLPPMPPMPGMPPAPPAPPAEG